MLLNVSNKNRRFLHSIPHSMVGLAQATFEQDCAFMNFRKVTKDDMRRVFTNSNPSHPSMKSINLMSPHKCNAISALRTTSYLLLPKHKGYAADL